MKAPSVGFRVQISRPRGQLLWGRGQMQRGRGQILRGRGRIIWPRGLCGLESKLSLHPTLLAAHSPTPSLSPFGFKLRPIGPPHKPVEAGPLKASVCQCLGQCESPYWIASNSLQQLQQGTQVGQTDRPHYGNINCNSWHRDRRWRQKLIMHRLVMVLVIVQLAIYVLQWPKNLTVDIIIESSVKVKQQKITQITVDTVTTRSKMSQCFTSYYRLKCVYINLESAEK